MRDAQSSSCVVAILVIVAIIVIAVAMWLFGVKIPKFWE